jgi:hypothetical protein
VDGLSLSPLALPREMAVMDGSWKGAPVRLEARAYAGPRIRYARFVHISGETLEIANALCLSSPEFALPILGVDLVDVGREAAVAVADLSPVLERPSAPGAARDLPSWCAAWFSPAALFARITPPDADAVQRRLLDDASAFVGMAEAAGADHGSTGRVRQRQDAYCTAHLDDDRGLQLLLKIFDPALGARFLRDVLFPRGDVVWA